MITTRGEKLNSFCKEMDNYCVNILYRTVIAEDFFVDIYCLDKDDDIYNPENYIKANPYLCTTTDGVETLLTDSQTARNMGGSELKDFIIKDLNLWCENTDNQYVDSEKWSQCGTYKTLKDFIGYECYVGLDLSSGGDLTTIALEFIDGSKYYFYSVSISVVRLSILAFFSFSSDCVSFFEFDLAAISCRSFNAMSCCLWSFSTECCANAVTPSLNVTLGAVYKDTSCIIVNDDGLNWLDTLKDNDGNYLLGYNPIEPKQMQLSVGANLIPVYNVPNSVMPSNDTQYPIIIGDLKEAIKYWDRQQITIDVSNTATVGNYNAFGQNLTIFRGLLRADVTLMDTQAIVYGYIDSSTS